MNSYYNTNKEQGKTLLKSEKNAQSQEERILEFFEKDLLKSGFLYLYSPSKILEVIFYELICDFRKRLK